MKTDHNQIKDTDRARICRSGALLGGLCLIVAGCASEHANERGDATVHAHSHEVHRDSDGVLRDRDGRVVRERDHDGVVHDRDGRVVRADDGIVRDKDGVLHDRDGRVVREDDGIVRDKDGVLHDRDGRVVRDDERVRAEAVSARDQTVKPVAIATPRDTEVDTDRQLSARIRKSIAADNTLSTNAKNVTITSNKDEVTLRGPVATADEKSRIATHAQEEAGARRVNNQLEVTR